MSMFLNEIIELDKKYYINTFGDRVPVSFTSGKGIKLTSTDGKEYTDLFAGVAVSALGHSHPALVKAITEQAAKLLHCSNYYYVENQGKLAKLLVENSFADKVFFSNSGAEANEAAIKLARGYFSKRAQAGDAGAAGKFEFISLNNSFHGRTLATVAATGTAKYQAPFAPLPAGFKKVDANDFEQLEAAASHSVCAIILETIMGEGGVIPLTTSYLQKVRKLCDEKDILLIIDEVQTGLGRTGNLFGYQSHGILPDIMTLAKALGGGFPIGAMLTSDKVASGFAPGDHGSTFAGGPLACAAGLAAVEEIINSKLTENAKKVGTFTYNALLELQNQLSGENCTNGCPIIKEVRGQGLMIGIELSCVNAGDVKNMCFENGYLVGIAGNNTLRLLPPLIVNEKDIQDFIPVLKSILEKLGGVEK